MPRFTHQRAPLQRRESTGRGRSASTRSAISPHSSPIRPRFSIAIETWANNGTTSFGVCALTAASRRTIDWPLSASYGIDVPMRSRAVEKLEDVVGRAHYDSPEHGMKAPCKIARLRMRGYHEQWKCHGKRRQSLIALVVASTCRTATHSNNLGPTGRYGTARMIVRRCKSGVRIRAG